MKKITQLLRSETLRDTAIVMLGLGVTTVAGFIYTVLLARTLGPSSFGIYSAVTALATIVYSLGDLGISSAIINFLPKNTYKPRLLIDTSFWIQFVVIVFSFIFFSIVAVFHQVIIPGSVSTQLILAGSVVVNYLIIGYAQGVFTAERRYWSYSFSQIFDSLIKVIVVYFLLQKSGLSIETAIGANVFSTFMAILITFGKDLYNIHPGVDKKVAIDIFHFAKWIAISKMFSVLISRVDILLLNLMSTSYAAGIFAAASRVTILFALLIGGLGSVVNSRFSSFDSSVKVKKYIKKLSLFVLAISLIMVVCTFFARQIIGLVYGDGYESSVLVFQWMTVVMIPFLFSLITTPAIIYTYNKPSFYAKITAIQVIGIVILDILLIPKFQFMAPVISLGITNLFVFFFTIMKLYTLIHDNKTLDHRQS